MADDKNEVHKLRTKLVAVEEELASAKLQIKLLEHRIQHGCPLDEAEKPKGK